MLRGRLTGFDIERGRLEENIGAVSVELTPDDLRQIDEAASKIKVEGDRYPEHIEKMSGL